MIRFVCLILTLLFSLISFADRSDCQNWFNKMNLAKDKSCVSKCELGSVDMATFSCRIECSKLCKIKSSNDYNLLKQYGLTDDEIKICDESPLKCIEAYKLSWDAENICLTKYYSSRTNDESDACRHFVWSILMAKNLGSDFSEKILNAHENNPHEPANERAMDLSNNRLGLLTFQKISEQKKLITNELIMSEFIDKIEKNSLVILKPRKP